jgi:uroporphyrin-III C-methyltransferase
MSGRVLPAVQALISDLPELEPGHVWLAGSGPGDPGCLTLQVIAGLAQADAVVYDALVNERVLALARSGVELIFAGKRGGRPSAHQADITARLIELSRAGRRVLRLKGGDPYVFGRGGEEALTLARAGVPFRVIAGVTSGLAALTAAAIPATMRGINQAIILATGHGGAEDSPSLDWGAIVRLNQPIAFYMALRRLDHIAAALLQAGMRADMPAAAVADATNARQRVIVATLADITAAVRRENLPAPAIVVIGEIVRVRAELLAAIRQSAAASRCHAPPPARAGILHHLR